MACCVLLVINFGSGDIFIDFFVKLNLKLKIKPKLYQRRNRFFFSVLMVKGAFKKSVVPIMPISFKVAYCRKVWVFFQYLGYVFSGRW